MRAGEDIERYLNAVINERLYSNKRNLEFQMDFIFKGIDFKNKRVLDIGGGCGLFSFYAGCRGADMALCLEPEAQGSTSGVQGTFRKLQGLLSAPNVLLETSTFQSFESDGETFDVILLHNSINHLNETACINLLKDENSRAVYQSIFSKLSSLSKKGTTLIICDCSRHNLFALLKIRNPFAPKIEWQKHQTPEVWVHMLGSVGFANPIIRWSSFNRLGSFGRVLIGNRLMAYFLTSHFCLSMVKE
jgi:SAM-dependent methyltransferase